MRIAIDIDSTLHHYWDVLSEISVRRFGDRAALRGAVHVGHHAAAPGAARAVRAGEPQRRAHPRGRALSGRGRRSVRGWHERRPLRACREPPARRCRRCDGRLAATRSGCRSTTSAAPASKVERCVRARDRAADRRQPAEHPGALEHGIVAATIVHPWNEEVCEEEDVISARDWHELARLLAPAGWCARSAPRS